MCGHAGQGLTPGVRGAVTGLVENSEDMQVQRKGGGRSVPPVPWTDAQCGSVSLSPPASLISHFQHLLVTPYLRVRFAGRPPPPSSWAKGCFWGTDSPAQPRSFPRPWQTLEQSCLQSSTWVKAVAGQGSGAGEAAKVGVLWGNCDLKAAIGITMGGTFPIYDCTLSCAVPAEWGCGTVYGRWGWARKRTGAMTQLPGGVSKDRYKAGISVAFVVEVCV